jgi:Protein of unknown function (DUF2997)
MTKTIEVVVSPQGATTVQTRGFAGSDCLAASKFLEQSLGLAVGERKTGEFHTSSQAEQRIRE